MAITYNAGTNIITVTGYTEATPCNFTDIYNADVAGGWGKVTKQGAKHFFFQCYLAIGDGSTTTHFADKDAYIYFDELGGNWASYIKVYNHAHFTLGELVDASKKSTRRGCTICHNATSNPKRIINILHGDAVCKFYSSLIANGGSYRGMAIYAEDSAAVPDVTLYNCSVLMAALSKVNNDIYNFTATGDKTVDSTYVFLSTSGLMDGVTIRNVTRPLYANYSYPMTVKNMSLYDYTDIGIYALATDIYFINCDIQFPTWNFNNNNNQGGKIYRQYEFDLKVTDKDNVAIQTATVKIWDKDSNLIVDTTTDASGDIATQTITRGYYNQANGNTLQEASPHLIKIEKAGYTTYEADFTLDDKTDWLIALQAAGGGLMRNPPMTGGMV